MVSEYWRKRTISKLPNIRKCLDIKHTEAVERLHNIGLLQDLYVLVDSGDKACILVNEITLHYDLILHAKK